MEAAETSQVNSSCPQEPPYPASSSSPSLPNPQQTDERAMAEDGEYFDDDESDEEEETATDLCGYRHINTVDSIDCYYGTYPADFPILGSFPTYHTEGDGIVQTMRHHLDFAVPKELIQDTYGHVKPVGEILSFNLPKLQARFWCEWPQMAARLTSFEAHEATEAEKMIAGAIASVAGILRENYVFVLRDRSHMSCSLPFCQQIHEEFSLRYQPHEIALEPLVDWATLQKVEVEFFQNQIILYRRTNYIRHEYRVNFRQFIPKDPVLLCVECLQFLCDRRIESWYLMINSPNLKYKPFWNKPVRETDNEDGSNSWSDSSSHEMSPCLAPREPFSETELEAFPQLDGAYELKRRRDHSFKIWTEPSTENATKDGDASVGEISPPKEVATNDGDASMADISPPKEVASSNPSQSPTTIITGSPQPSKLSGSTAMNTPDNDGDELQPVKRSGWTAINTPDAEADELLLMLYDGTDPTAGQPFIGTFTHTEQEMYPNVRASFPKGELREREFRPGFKFLAPEMLIDRGTISPDRSPRSPPREDVRLSPRARGFGREIEANLLTPTKRMRISSISPLPLSTSPITESVSRNRRSPQVVIKPRPSFSGQSIHSPVNLTPTQSRSLNRPTVPVCLTLPKPKPMLHPASTGSRLKPTMGTPALAKKYVITADPIFAKECEHRHPSASPGQDYPLKRLPSALELICTCRKPAQTHVVKIVQCYNPQCRIQWYHYPCLNKSAKLSARHGKWQCETCLGEEEWNDKSKKNKTQDLAKDIMAKISAQELELEDAKGRDPYAFATLQIEYEDGGKITSHEDGAVNDEDSRMSTPRVSPPTDSKTPDNSDADKPMEDVSKSQPSPLGNLSFFNLTPSQPYWLTRAYSTNNADFSRAFIDREVAEKGDHADPSEPYHWLSRAYSTEREQSTDESAKDADMNEWDEGEVEGEDSNGELGRKRRRLV